MESYEKVDDKTIKITKDSLMSKEELTSIRQSYLKQIEDAGIEIAKLDEQLKLFTIKEP